MVKQSRRSESALREMPSGASNHREQSRRERNCVKKPNTCYVLKPKTF
jgi:hypothetical protein